MSLKTQIPSLISLSRVFLGISFYIILDVRPLTPIVVFLILFFLIEISDFLDGFIARKAMLQSDFGKLFDPVCDISAHFLCLFALQRLYTVPATVLIIFIMREIWVTFLRATLTKRNIVLAAKFSGKLKTFLFALVILFGIISLPQSRFVAFTEKYWVYYIMFSYFAAFVSLFSGLHYFLAAYNLTKNKPSK